MNCPHGLAGAGCENQKLPRSESGPSVLSNHLAQETFVRKVGANKKKRKGESAPASAREEKESAVTRGGQSGGREM